MLLYVLEHGSSGLLAFSKICHGLFHKILTVNVKKYDPDVANSILNPLYRSSRSEVFLVKGALKTCSKFTGEHPCRSVISIQLLRNFTEITIRHGCSPVNLLHIFRTPFTKNISGWLLLTVRLFGV